MIIKFQKIFTALGYFWGFSKKKIYILGYEDFVDIFFFGSSQNWTILKTYAAISHAHLSRVWKQVKLPGSCLSTCYGFGSTQLSDILCHISVPTFS